jgi:hypothetical protein
MDAVYRGYNWRARQALAVLVVALTAALLAGGLGGYLIRSVATLSYNSSTASPTVTRSSVGALSEPHDVAARSQYDLSARTGLKNISASAATSTGPLFTEPHDTGR